MSLDCRESAKLRGWASRCSKPPLFKSSIELSTRELMTIFEKQYDGYEYLFNFKLGADGKYKDYSIQEEFEYFCNGFYSAINYLKGKQ